jgi:hypothetical protein
VAGDLIDLQLGSSDRVATTNDPLFLAPDVLGYVYLPGVASNFLSVPDEAALDLSGDCDLRFFISMDDWTPSSETVLVTKGGTGASNFAYNVRIRTNGTIRWSWSTTGSDATSVDSTVTTGVTDGSGKWVRVTFDADNGASGNDAKFFLSDDGVTWTQLGSTVTTAGVVTIFNSASVLRFGQAATVNSFLAGKFYRAQIYSDLTETNKVLDIDCDAITDGSATSFTALTGQTVTINRSTAGRKSVAVPRRNGGGRSLFLFGNDDYMECVKDWQHQLLNFDAQDSFTVVAVVRQWATPLTNRALVNKFEETNGWNLRQLTTQFANQGLLVSGEITVADNGPTLIQSNGSLSMHGMLVNRSTQQLTAFTNNTTSGSPSNISTVGSVANSVPFRIGGISSGTPSYQNLELVAVAVFRRALTPDEIRTITDYYTNRGY